MKIALINMPFGDFTLPAIGISLLQAGLRQQGITCDTYYQNFHFAARIGCLTYFEVNYSWPWTALAGEWLFVEDLFGPDSRRDQRYIENILKGEYAFYFRPRRIRRLLELRACVRRFLDESMDRVPWTQYDMVGFTSSFQQNLASLALAKRVKAAFPGKKIIFGGANCEGEMGIELHRQFPFIDFVCSGEGDQAFPELVRRLAAGEDTSRIAGIISRAGRETVVPSEIVSPIFDLDALPYPCYDDYFAQLKKAGLNRRFTPNIPYETSRGCWWGAKMHCTFCGLNGATMAYRSKSPQRALDELLHLGRKYGKNIQAVDNILDLKYLDSFFPALAAQSLRFNLFFETKVNLTKAQLTILRDAGTKRLQPGIESLSSSVLRLMKKGCNLLQNVQFLKWCRQLGVKAAWNFIYGFPGESPVEYARMANFIPSLTHLEPPHGVSRLRLDRFSPYFTRPADFGLSRIRARQAYSHLYPFEPDAVHRLAYNFDFDCPSLELADEYAQPTVRQVKAWRRARFRGHLKGKFQDGALVIVDTRKRRKRSTRALEDPLKTAYIFCDQARALSEIKAHLLTCFPERTFTDSWLEESLNDLVSRGLMLREGNSLLSLAILPISSAITDSQAPFADKREEIRPKDLVQLGAAVPVSVNAPAATIAANSN
jgi:ribosomal peptide maturation radical SAM protein 1